MKNAANVLEKNKAAILDDWSNRVKKSIEASTGVSDVTLRDHLPNMLNDIIGIFSRHDGKEHKIEKYEEIIENSNDHGRMRATTSNYTVDQIIHEYIIFHRVVTETLEKENAYTYEVATLLKYIVETAMLRSTRTFTASMENTQEKLMGTLAHDIRNPLSVALSSIEHINKDQDTEAFKKTKSLAMRSIQKAINLTEGLLDTITLKAGEGIMLTFSEGDYLEEINWVFKEACEVYTQRLKLICPDEKIEGVFDGMALRRLLENLVTNAIKYGNPTKEITITVKDLDENVCLQVHNYGNAIPIEKQKSIFEFLDHGHDNSTSLQSWGMGLTLVKIIAEAHNGKVELESSENKGTTFTIILKKHANKTGKVRTRIY